MYLSLKRQPFNAYNLVMAPLSPQTKYSIYIHCVTKGRHCFHSHFCNEKWLKNGKINRQTARHEMDSHKSDKSGQRIRHANI